MTSNNEAVRKLGIHHPIIQGPFGGGFSTARLAALVSNRGGLGSFGAHGLNPDEISTIAGEIRSLTEQPFALNLWVSDHDPGGEALNVAEFDRLWPNFEPFYRELGIAKPELPQRFHQKFEDQVEGLIAANPPAFSFAFGVPASPILVECKRRGIVTIGAATSIAEAQLLDQSGVDLIVATGFEAGGHRPSFLTRAEDSLMGTLALTQLVASRVKAPVIAAGGIADARGIRSVLTLGAQAAQIGTAFLACEESGATQAHRQVLFSEQAQNTTLTRAFSGRLARGVKNRWVEEMAARFSELPPFPIQNWLVSNLKPAAVAAGRTDLVSLWSGQVAPNLCHHSATDLMDALVSEL